jgi:predicted glycoside hydrolase/deacetylase ChbG (UPF0249 family)
METIQLIVNADDYGRTPGVSQGIREAHLRGIVTSTTAMMNMPGVEAELRRAMQETPNLGLGVHLVLTSGAPLLPAAQVTTITNGRDRFPSQQEFLAKLKSVDENQVAAEWGAQIRRFIKITGRNPDHLDSHHHTSYYSESLFDAFLGLAKQYRCAIRSPIPCPSGNCDGLPPEIAEMAREFVPRLNLQFKPAKPDWLIGTFYDEQAISQQLLLLLDQLKPGISELMCHPGFTDPALLSGSAYNRPRERELAILTSELIRKAIQSLGIQLINFGDLQRPADVEKK